VPAGTSRASASVQRARAEADAQLSSQLDRRVRALNDSPEDPRGAFVLLWLQGQRRLSQNLAYAHAQRRANELGKPLVVYEALRFDHPHASDRFHRFVLEGARDNAREAARRGLAYRFFLQTPDSPRGALLALAAQACLAVTDWLPAFIHPSQTRAFAQRARVRVEAVDAAGVAPLSISDKIEIGARTLRPKLHRALPELLRAIVEPDAQLGARPVDWGFDAIDLESDAAIDRAIAALPIDHAVRPVSELRGGRASAQRRLSRFLDEGLAGYAGHRNEPSLDQHASWLSPFLHFGHLGALEIALAARAHVEEKHGASATSAAARELRADLDSFLEELIVRRELGLNFCAREPRHEQYESLPGWARATLAQHASDPRPQLLDDEALERAESPDEIWNAAQRQLVAQGRIHGYLRMLWGKLLLLWSRDGSEALRRMRLFNDKYALDGRDANSDMNFLWCLGLHDRPFPERAIYGTVRSMTSRSTRSKFDLDAYLARWGSAAP